MARVSLILPQESGIALTAAEAESFQRGLATAGHTVEIVGVVDPRSPRPTADFGPWWRTVQSKEPGAGSGAVAGLLQASGDVLVVLDSTRGYRLDEVLRVIDPVDRGDADLVVASRTLAEGSAARPGLPARWLGLATRRLLGSSDVRSGLVALSRDLARATDLEPLGSNFTLELLLRCGGRRLDLAADPHAGSRRPAFGWDDLRHLKRLGDYKFGNFSRLIQFCVVGASGMVVDLSCYALFQWLLSRTALANRTAPLVGGPLVLAVAGALAIGLALTWNFSLNRRLTFSYARRGSLVRQFLGYALSNALGIALSFTLRLLLPRYVSFFNRHRLAAAVVGIVAATGISFSMARWFVFARRPGLEPVEPTSDRESTFGDSAEADDAGDGAMVGQSRPTPLSSFEVS